jgi:hypothetical protein
VNAPAPSLSAPIGRQPGRLATGARASTTHPSWRSEITLCLAIAGAAFMTFVPGAWLASSGSYSDLLMFAVINPCTYGLIAGAQILALRRWRDDSYESRKSPGLRMLVAASVGVAVACAVGPAVDPYAERLGLIVEGSGSSALISSWTSLLIGAFLIWHREGVMRRTTSERRLRDVQEAQLAARRALIDADMRAVQARVDPQTFFDVLDAIEHLYKSDSARADKLFDELIVFLRAALPRIDSPSSTLAEELNLVAARVRMYALASGEDVSLSSSTPSDLLACSFPSGLLLPIVSEALAAGSGPRCISLDASMRPLSSALGSTLDVLIHVPNRTPPQAVEHAALTLRSLFGSKAYASIEQAGLTAGLTNGTTIQLHIEHEYDQV